MMNNFLVCKIIFIVLISILLGVDGAVSTVKQEEPKPSEVPQIFNYGEYVERFRKNYSPLETLSKARLFFGRTLKIFQHNVMYKIAKKTYYLNQNQFTDIPGDELKTSYLSNESLRLKQVVEAKDNPNKPASSVVGEAPEGADDDDNDVGYSSCAVDGEGNCDDDRDKNRGETILDFFADQDVDNLSGMIAKLKAKPELAEEMASVVGIKNTALLEELQNLEEIRKSNMIEKKPVVESNNENYDPETIVSYGLFSRRESELTAENYAKFLMDDEFALEPYPIHDDFESDDDDVGRRGSNLKNLLGTVKNIFDFFADTDYDWYQPVVDDEQEKKDKNANKKDSNGVNNSPVEGTITYDVDWRKTGCISKPKTQLSCNSCYAFTTLSLMEYFYCSQTKELTEFSAQYIVDCGPRFKLAGCKGGKISGVGTFIKKFGLELETMYPYVGKENQCPIPEDGLEKEERAGYLKPEITHWHNFPEMTAWYKWLPKSPMIVGINMPSDFFAYGGGIHDGADCLSEMVHALLLVGSGAQDGKKFWLLKNSFSDSWGENGYIRVSKDAPLKCFNTATVVRVKFNK